MSTATRRPLAEMRALAEQLVTLLAPSCEKIAIAGSIRRQQPDVGDIELVAVPGMNALPDLFGDHGSEFNLLDGRVREGLGDGWLDVRLDKNGMPRNGQRYKALTYQGVPLDFFSVLPGTEAQWGVIYLLRTGPAEFGHRLVTRTRQGGWLPDYLQVKAGALRHRRGGELVPTPEEEQVFELIGRPWIPPEARR